MAWVGLCQRVPRGVLGLSGCLVAAVVLRLDLSELLLFTLPLGCSSHVRGTCAFLAVLGPILRDSDTSVGMSCSASCGEVQWLNLALGLR